MLIYKLRTRYVKATLVFLITKSWLCVDLVPKHFFIGNKRLWVSDFSSFLMRINMAKVTEDSSCLRKVYSLAEENNYARETSNHSRQHLMRCLRNSTGIQREGNTFGKHISSLQQSYSSPLFKSKVCKFGLLHVLYRF